MKTHLFRVIGKVLVFGFLPGIAVGLGIYFVIVNQISKSHFESIDLRDNQNLELNPVPLESPPTTSEISHIKEIAAIVVPFERNVALFQLVVDATLDELNEFWEDSKSVGNLEVRLQLQETLSRRFAQIDPVLVLQKIFELPPLRSRGLVRAVFREWSGNDLGSAVAYLPYVPEGSKLAALEAVLQTHDHLPLTERKAIARSVGLEQLAEVAATELSVLRANTGPREAWNNLVTDEISDGLQRDFLYRTVLSGLERDGLEFLIEIHEEFRTWDDTMLVLKLLQQAVQVYALSDPQSAFEKALTLPNNSSETAREAIVSVWAVTDPIGALNAMSRVESQSKRQRLQELILIHWAKSNPQEVIDRLRVVPAYLKPFAREQVIVELAIRDPLEAVRLLKDRSNEFSFESHVASVVRYWVQNDPGAAFAWLREDPEVSKWRSQILPAVLIEYSFVDPHKAFDIGLSYGVEDQVIYGIVDYDSGLALELAKRANGNNKGNAMSIVGEHLVKQREYDQALELADLIPEKQRDGYFDQVIAAWETYYPRILYNSIEELPKVLHSQAALRLLMHHTPRIFDEQETDWLKSLLEKDEEVIFKLWTNQTSLMKSSAEDTTE